jgi:autotransporter-associated beta strand protein
VSQIGAAAQYQGFGTFNKIDSSVWTLTGTSSYAGPVNVNGGTLAVNGDISSASSLTVNAGGTLGGNGIAGAGQFDRAVDRAGQPHLHGGVELHDRSLAR